MRRSVVCVIAGLALSACGSEVTSSATLNSESRAIYTASQALRTYDDDLAEVARQNPGFGGIYFDEAGRMVAVMKDPANVGQMGNAIKGFLERNVFRGSGLASKREDAVRGMRAVQARWSFDEL